MATNRCHRWEITGNKFISTNENGTLEEFEICSIVAASLTPYIKAVFEDGRELECHLKDFIVGKQEGFKEEYRKSRTLFLNWLNWKKLTSEEAAAAEQSLTDNAEPDISLKLNATNGEYTNNELKSETTKGGSFTGKLFEENSQEINIQLKMCTNKIGDESKDNFDEGNVQVDKDNSTPEDNILDNGNDVKLDDNDGSLKEVISHNECLDKEVIQRKLKGSNVKVHIDNLVEPETNMNIRNINDDHVKELADAMLHSYDQYTTLVGMVPEGCSIGNLHVAGSDKVQVLGGNHTRAALKLLQTSGAISQGDDYKYVRMDLYENLGEMQSLLIAYRHNDIHERAKPMNFQEKVLLFRRLWIKKKTAMQDKAIKTIASAWRSDIAIYTNKTKEGLKSAFKTHLTLASCAENTWHELEAVFVAYNQKEIKGQKPKDELTQYPFFFFFRVKEHCKQTAFLRKLSNGEISLEELRTMCMSVRTPHDKVTEHETEENESCVGSKVKRSNDNKIQKRKTKQKPKAEEENVPSENDNSGLLSQIEILQKRLNEEEIHKTCLEDQVKALKEENQKLKEPKEEESKQLSDLKQLQTNLEKKVLLQKQMLKANTVTEEKLHKELEVLTCRVEVAEGAASRARAAMVDSTSKKVKTLKNNSSNELQSPEMKRPCTGEDTTLHVSKKRKTDDELTNISRVEESIHATKTESNKSEVGKFQMDIAMVEYTNRKIYLGCFDVKKKKLTFAKAPVRQINNSLQFSEQSLTLNQKDVQEIDSGYIIKKIKCEVNNNKMFLSELQKQCFTKTFIQYAKKKM